MATTIFLLFSLLISSQVLAWGELGHRTVGYLAGLYFSTEAETLFNELVKPTDTFDISDGAVWADGFGVQHRMPWSKPWHYIDAKDDPPTQCRLCAEGCWCEQRADGCDTCCEWDWQGPEDLSKEYYEGAVHIVEDQIAKAGWRLGQWVNALAEQRVAMKKAGVVFGNEMLQVQPKEEM